MKNIKKIIIPIIMVSLVVGYYFYLSHRNDYKDSTDIVATDTELSKLMTRDIISVYPQLPEDVVGLYSRIMKAYYYTKLTDKEIEKLGNQARLLFDEELLLSNPLDIFMENLKADIAAYEEKGLKIYEWNIEDLRNVKEYTFKEQSYIDINVAYLLRRNKEVMTVRQTYTLRKDEEGKWKILFWKESKPLTE